MKKPHIIVLMGDEHPVFYAGCYGHDLVRTPTLDALAAHGAVFDSAYCASPICAPCRAAMMTSRYVHELEVWDNASPLRCDWPTFAHDFGAAGYRTVLCGKMHFVGPDQLHGFEERWTPDIYPATVEWTRSNRAAAAINDGGQTIQTVYEAGPGHCQDNDYDDNVCAQAEAGLRRVLTEPDRPVMAVVSFTAPHFPFKAPQKYHDLYRDARIPLPEWPEDYRKREHAYVQGVRRMIQLDEPVPDEVCRTARIAIMARTTMLDDYLARVMAAVEEAGSDRPTYIVYCSDHGDMMGEHNLWFKNTAYEWSARVPFIIAGPGIEPRRIGETVSLHDLNPTLAGLASIPMLDYIRVGRDLAPLLRQERKSQTGEAIIENYGEGIWKGVRTIVRGKWKLSACDGAEPELFNLETDPGEWRNLAADHDHAAIRDELLAALHASWADPASLDEKRWQSEERRLAILASHRDRRRPLPMWQDDWHAI